MGTKILPPLPETLPEKKATQFQFLLGADDAEMREIESVLRRENMRWAYGTVSGARVHPGNAYVADPVTILHGHTLVLIECEPRNFSVEEKVHRMDGSLLLQATIRIIDHHRKGDPGFALPPRYYWEASSLGQLYAMLGKKNPSRKERIIAARDHCRFQAQNGLCGDLTPQEIEDVGRAMMAEELHITREELDRSIKKWKQIMRRASRVRIGRQHVTDLTKMPVEQIYSIDHLSIYEASAELRTGAVILTKNRAIEPGKVVLLGHLHPSTVRYFTRVWAAGKGLVDIYGCEVRGYAGGYYRPIPKVIAA